MPVESVIRMVRGDHIIGRDTIRPLDPDHVRELMMQIAIVGGLTDAIKTYKLSDEEVADIARNPEKLLPQCRAALANPIEDLLGLIDGGHRMAAIDLLGWPQIRAEVFTRKPEAEMLIRQQILPNVSQKRLDPLSAVLAVIDYTAQTKCSVATACNALGIQPALFSRSKWILGAGDKIQGWVRERLLNGDHIALLKKADPEKREKLAERVVKEDLKAHELKKLMQEGKL